MNRLTREISIRTESMDMSVPPRYMYLRWSANMVEMVKQPKMMQVDRNAVGMMLGLMNSAMSRSGPMDSPEQRASAIKYPIRVDRFFGSSWLEKRARPKPRTPKLDSRPPDQMVVYRCTYAPAAAERRAMAMVEYTFLRWSLTRGSLKKAKRNAKGHLLQRIKMATCLHSQFSIQTVKKRLNSDRHTAAYDCSLIPCDYSLILCDLN